MFWTEEWMSVCDMIKKNSKNIWTHFMAYDRGEKFFVLLSKQHDKTQNIVYEHRFYVAQIIIDDDVVVFLNDFPQNQAQILGGHTKDFYCAVTKWKKFDAKIIFSYTI